MKLGLALPHYDFSFPEGGPATVERVLGYAERAERAGFESVWVSDHLFFDLAKYGGGPERQGTPEAMTLLAAIAARTARVRLGPLVLCAAFRHPRMLAHEALTIAGASGGRLEVGLGAGWYEPEFTAAGIPFGTVGSRMGHLERVAGMLDGMLPAEVPLWIGGKGGPRILRIAAEHADGWNIVWRVAPEELAARIEALRGACAGAGRDPAAVRVSVGLYCLLGEDERDLAERYRALKAWTPGGALDAVPLEEWAAGAIVGTPDACARRLKEYEALGVDRVILGLGSMPFSVWDDSQIDLVARALL